MRRSSVLSGCALALLASAAAGTANAEDSVWSREKLTGDWNGARSALSDRGVEIGINYIGETLGILSGGLRRGTSYEGRLDVAIDTDLEKLIGWRGGRTQVRGFQIHDARNRNAADFVGSIADPSNIDALPTTRLFTAWFQQDLGTSGSFRIGQLAADDEFLTSATAGGLINGTFGWATIMAANLPSGGAAYPLATPGARLEIKLNDAWAVRAGVFSGDPAGWNCTANPQACNRYGTTFSLQGGAFLIGEAQYQVNQEKDAVGLAAAYKFGVWYHNGAFADQRFGFDPALGPVTLAATPTPDPLYHDGNWGVYGVIDQMLWRDGPRSVSLFLRGGGAPSDRNLLSWYVDGGIGFKGIVPGRPDDTLTFGVAHSGIGRNATALDRDTLLLNGPPYPIRKSETVLEASYILQLTPWWTLQPDIQYIVRPGGNVPDPDDPARVVGNALVIGARTAITF